MIHSFIKKLKAFAITAIVIATVASCGKRNFDIATAPPDIGGNKDSAKKLIDTTLKFDNSRIAQASIWPGLVCSTEPRLPSVVLNMDLNYKSAGINLRESVAPAPLFSTGYYAAPGELITIDVPAGIYSLSVQIGSSTEDLSSRVNPARDPIIFVKSQLSPGRNYLRNLYGGTILINSDVPIPNAVSITLGNVVKSPDFVLGQTDPVQWKAAIQNSCVPLIELRSRYISFTVPRVYCIESPIADINWTLAQWDSVVTQDYYAWEGLSFTPSDPVDQAPLLPYRIVFDIQLANPKAYGHSGNPVMVVSDKNWFSGIAGISNGIGDWGFLHEIGHNNQQNDYWSWSTLGETSNNLFAFKVANRMSKLGFGVWPREGTAMVTQLPLALAFAADAGSKDFDGADTRIDDPFARLTPFVQLFDYIKPNMPGINKSSSDGWALMGAFYSQSRRAVRPNISDLSKHDFVYRAVCNMTQYNWLDFFNAWGITVSDVAAHDMAVYPDIKYKVWEYNPLTRTGGTGLSDPYVSSNWKILSFSSQEPTGEGPPNGLATSIIDGNLSTFWHSQWSAATAAPPHTIVVDLRKTLSFNSFYYAHRSSGTRLIKNLYFDYSTDNVTWKSAPGSPFLLSKTNFGKLTYNLGSTVTARYVRIGTKTTADVYEANTYAAIAEFGIVKP